MKPIENLPVIWSYAFENGDKRSLILVNLDLHKPQKVKVEHGDAGNNAMLRTVTADKFTDHSVRSKAMCKIRDGPLQSEYRFRLQTTVSCVG